MQDERDLYRVQWPTLRRQRQTLDDFLKTF